MRSLSAILLLLILPTTLQAASNLTVIGRYYAPGGNISGTPAYRAPMVGEFVVEYASPGKLSLIGAMDTRIHRRPDGWRTVGSIYYHVGIRWQAMPRALIELKHGSWHNIDAVGPNEIYNRVGLEVRLP